MLSKNHRLYWHIQLISCLRPKLNALQNSSHAKRGSCPAFPQLESPPANLLLAHTASGRYSCKPLRLTSEGNLWAVSNLHVIQTCLMKRFLLPRLIHPFTVSASTPFPGQVQYMTSSLLPRLETRVHQKRTIVRRRGRRHRPWWRSCWWRGAGIGRRGWLRFVFGVTHCSGLFSGDSNSNFWSMCGQDSVLFERRYFSGLSKMQSLPWQELHQEARA